MTSFDRPPELVISGVGVTAAVGQGLDAFASALLEGRTAFGVMRRPGRQRGESRFLGAEIGTLACPAGVDAHAFRTASIAGQAALAAVAEAWQDARLLDVDPARIGLVIGGSNLQQRELALSVERYASQPQFVRPSHAVSFMDSDLCGLCTEQFGIKGLWSTVGGASASGQLAVWQAMQAVRGGSVDVCIAVGALMDLSYLECQAFRSAGAMGSDRFAARPDLACRPFDRERDGFIYGEACGAVVVERAQHCRRGGVQPRARLASCVVGADANRRPNPSLDGEVEVIARALDEAGLSPADIDYVNPHGSGSRLGDEVELQALRRARLTHARINATKSVVGHGLSAAGTIELIATIVQMDAGRLHPSLNLVDPEDEAFQWVGGEAEAHRIERALSLSFGFGGLNTASCIERL